MHDAKDCSGIDCFCFILIEKVDPLRYDFCGDPLVFMI